jgi:hypothetical protein
MRFVMSSRFAWCIVVGLLGAGAAHAAPTPRNLAGEAISRQASAARANIASITPRLHQQAQQSASVRDAEQALADASARFNVARRDALQSVVTRHDVVALRRSIFEISSRLVEMQRSFPRDTAREEQLALGLLSVRATLTQITSDQLEHDAETQYALLDLIAARQTLFEARRQAALNVQADPQFQAARQSLAQAHRALRQVR